MKQWWVTYPSHFSTYGKVHNLDCRYAGTGHGRMLNREEIAEYASKAEDCKVCGGLG